MRTVASMFFFAIVLCCSITALAQTSYQTEEPNYDTLIEATEIWRRVYKISAQLPEEYRGSEAQVAIEIAIDLLSRLPADRSLLTEKQRSQLEAIETWLNTVDPQEPQRNLRLVELFEGSGDRPPMRSVIRRTEETP